MKVSLTAVFSLVMGRSFSLGFAFRFFSFLFFLFLSFLSLALALFLGEDGEAEGLSQASEPL